MPLNTSVGLFHWVLTWTSMPWSRMRSVWRSRECRGWVPATLLPAMLEEGEPLRRSSPGKPSRKRMVSRKNHKSYREMRRLGPCCSFEFGVVAKYGEDCDIAAAAGFAGVESALLDKGIIA